MVKATKCELWRGDRWEEIDIDEALDIRAKTSTRYRQKFPMRCCDCHGRVRAHKRANNDMRAHFEHLVAHEGCRRSTKFAGTQSRHPEALT